MEDFNLKNIEPTKHQSLNEEDIDIPATEQISTKEHIFDTSCEQQEMLQSEMNVLKDHEPLQTRDYEDITDESQAITREVGNIIESKASMGENSEEDVLDEILNPPISSNKTEVEIEEIEDEIENHPDESDVNHTIVHCLHSDTTDQMPEIKLFVTDDPKKPSKPNEKESKLDEEKQSDEQDVKIQQTKEKIKLKSVPIVSPKKKKKKGRAEVSTFISKPFGLVTPLEKQKKRMNYLEMHTGKLSPVSMIKSEENKKTVMDESEATTSTSESNESGTIKKKTVGSNKSEMVHNPESKNTKRGDRKGAVHQSTEKVEPKPSIVVTPEKPPSLNKPKQNTKKAAVVKGNKKISVESENKSNESKANSEEEKSSDQDL